MYRRYAGRDKNYDFSLESLIDCYNRETKGMPAKKNNGYLYGKWAKDITVATWREDIRAGQACKAEFHTVIDRWWSVDALSSVVVPVWFPWNLQEQMNSLTVKQILEFPEN